MTLDSLPDLDTSGLCLVKTLSTALTCWPYRNTALRDGARTSTRTSSVAKGRTASTPLRRSYRARPSTPSTSSSNIRCRNCCMLCRAKTSSVSQVGLDAATDSVLFFPTGGVSFCSGVDRARGSFGEPKVTPPFLVYTLSDVTSQFGATWTNVQTTRMALVILKYESPLEKKRGA